MGYAEDSQRHRNVLNVVAGGEGGGVKVPRADNMPRAPRNVNAALTQSRIQGSLWSLRPALRESWVRGCHALSPSFHAGLTAVIVCRGVHQLVWRSILVKLF